YAECFDDLQKKDQMNGELKTGDIAKIGPNGLFYITGRIKRIIKLNGTRVSLDEIEKEISSETKLSIFAIGNDGILKIIIYKNAKFSDESLNIIKLYLSKKLRLLKKQYEINIIDTIPFLDNGKIDYGTLKSLYGIK
ncbi:MAG: phosphatase, partial [Gammaproteobacteria bacterium]